MSVSEVQLFNNRIAGSPDLQLRLEKIASPIDLMTFAQELGLTLTREDIGEIVQWAYGEWLRRLDLPGRVFFEHTHQTPEINGQLRDCQSPDDALNLAQRYSFTLTFADLQQAATVAAAIPGFSFEKLWFRNLGLL